MGNRLGVTYYGSSNCTTSVFDRLCHRTPPPALYSRPSLLKSFYTSFFKCVNARRDLLVKHLTLLTKNQGLR